MTPIVTRRLTLRPMSTADAGFMLTLLNEPSFVRNIGDRGVRTIGDAESYITVGPMASYARFGFGLYLVELTQSGASIGICGLVKRETLADVDLGFAFLPPFWSQGYGLESASAVRDHARDAVGLRRLVAITDPANTGSIRLLAKLGFGFERMVRLGDEHKELKLFGCDFSEPRPIDTREDK
jgi:[ribosomal protein S5]-alanine N-acetyltransferase